VASADPLVDRLRAGDARSLARALTRVDDGDPALLPAIAALWDARRGATVLGITGPPGAGKSTLTDRAIRRYRDRGERVAVLAIDPSSPFSGGALLGDRIRMQHHAADHGVFIRSHGTRGYGGGLTRTTLEATILCAAAGFSRILVETVGVGQTELDVAGVADTVLVVLVPEAGDAVQTLKAGLLEVADAFVVNKADREGADLLVRELRAIGEGRPFAPLVFAASALRGDGLDALWDGLEALPGRAGRRLPADRLAARLFAAERLRGLEAATGAALGRGGRLEALGDALRSGRQNPYEAVLRMLADAD
jgi:LAO/AO transport system kinase